MEHKTFKFEKVSDFYQLNHEEFERFLEDFKIWFGQGKMMKALEEQMNNELGKDSRVVITLPQSINWVDDHSVGVKSFRVKHKIHIGDEIVEKNFKVNITEE